MINLKLVEGDISILVYNSTNEEFIQEIRKITTNNNTANVEDFPNTMVSTSLLVKSLTDPKAAVVEQT